MRNRILAEHPELAEFSRGASSPTPSSSLTLWRGPFTLAQNSAVSAPPRSARPERHPLILPCPPRSVAAGWTPTLGGSHT
jgi:hypothetical protein